MWRHEVLREEVEEEGFLKEGFLLAAEDSMSSGFGHQTPTGRCFPVFMEFKECVATETDFSKCLDLREDYMECLHHKKEVSRFNALNAERERKRKAGESLPPLVSEQVKKGEVKLPWTTATL